jgi:hypothetical protein
MRILTLIAVIALWLVPAPAFAQETEDPEITNQAKLHFKAGQEAYASGKYDTAIKELKRAYVLKRIPAILMNIAMTYRKTKDYEMALYFYRKFLAEAPADDKMRSKVEQEVTEVEQERIAASQPQNLEPAKPAFEMARPAPPADPTKIPPAAQATKPAEAGKTADPAKAATPGGPATATASGPGAPTTAPAQAGAPTPTPEATAAAPADKPVTEWSHTPIDAVPPGKPVDVRVQMPVMKGVKVKVFFRKEGQANFESVELKRRGNEKIARLPESVSAGRTFQYYVEARDGAGTIVKSSGNDSSPNIVLIDPTARPQLVDASGIAETSDEDEPARRVKAGPKRDIENEAVSFDIGGPKQKSAMERLRDQLRGDEKKRDRKLPLTALGFTGIAAAVVGLGVLAGGIGSFAVAANDAAIVSADSRCENSKNKCLFFGPNDDPALNKAANPPTSAYEEHGRLYDKIGTALTAVGGVVLVAGGALIAGDLIRKHLASRPPAPKKRKVKKVIEVEETVSSLIVPYAGPQGAGLVGIINF